MSIITYVTKNTPLKSGLIVFVQSALIAVAFFLDSAVCTHLVGCCLLDSISSPGVLPRKFNSRTKSRKRKAGHWHEKD